MRGGDCARGDFSCRAQSCLEKIIQIMQTNEIKEATAFDSLFVQTAPTVLHLLLYLVCFSGILVCLWAFRKSRKTGYLIVGAYFLHPVIAFLLVHMFGHAAVAPQQTATPTDL